MLKLIGSSLAALLFVIPGAGPQDKRKPSPSGDPQVTLSFRQLDLDGDHKVTREEFTEAFARLDRNRDGALTADELGSRGSSAPKAKPGKGKRKR